jgi:hypothetical protein
MRWRHKRPISIAANDNFNQGRCHMTERYEHPSDRCAISGTAVNGSPTTSPRSSRKIPASRSSTSRSRPTTSTKRVITQPNSFDILDTEYFSLKKLVPSGNSCRHGRQEDQGIRQDHAGLHQGRVAERQEDRRPGHRAQEGDVPRRRALHEFSADADRMDDADPDRLQRRHARHPARPDQAPDRFLGRIAEPRVQGQGRDPQHSLDRHHGRGDGRRGDRPAQISATRAT